MIKGWRNDPSWVSHYEGRQAAKDMLKNMKLAVEAQQLAAAFQQRLYEENRQHNAECHAKMKGEFMEPTVN